MTIILFTSVFFNNIGNGFIDLGAEAAIKEAMPEGSTLLKLSQCANFAATMDWKFRLRENPMVSFVWENLMRRFAKQLHDRSYSMMRCENVISSALIAKCDYFIVPGCVLTVPFFTIYGNLLLEKARQGAKIIFLGASGNHYTSGEVSYVSGWLEQIKPCALMFRDSVAFNAYSSLSKLSYNGIDNVFFVNKIPVPAFETIYDPYYVLNFDLKENQHIRKSLESGELSGKNIIYTDHKPYPQSKLTNRVKEGVIISDYPLDYLAVYRNVKTTYSDRVHACIPTLSFGNYARLFSRSPRKALFENVGLLDINSKPVKINNLDNYQQLQVNFLKTVLES